MQVGLGLLEGAPRAQQLLRALLQSADRVWNLALLRQQVVAQARRDFVAKPAAEGGFQQLGVQRSIGGVCEIARQDPGRVQDVRILCDRPALDQVDAPRR